MMVNYWLNIKQAVYGFLGPNMKNEEASGIGFILGWRFSVDPW